MSQQNHPPVTLVKTWVALLSSDSKEVRERANQMLHDAFADTKAVIEFCKKHNIKA